MAHYRTINHSKKFIAFFSPKCGSTTVKDWFSSSLGLAPNLHVEMGDYMISAEAVEKEKHSGYRKIFFIRNPFQRLVSFYCGFVVQHSELWCFADEEGEHQLAGRSFAQLVNTLALLAEQGKPFQHHLQPQLQGVEGVHFDTVIQIENFDAEIPALNSALGIHYEPRRLNATRYRSGDSSYVYDLEPEKIAELGTPKNERFYNDELIDIVSRLFRDDIKYYELHSVGPPEAAA